jgi:putative nucleotidyltransferase with HDIG domain/PAS domain S-box-containing protein
MKKNINILIVEDDEAIVEFTKALISTFLEGRVDAVSSGEDAVSYVEKHNPDIVLMDIILSGHIDGIEAAEQIHLFSDVPIIYTTGHNDDFFLKRAKITNPFGYLTKPIELRDLQAVITIAMQQYEQKKLLLRENYITQSLKKIYYPLFITDAKGSITSINEATQTLFGITETAILGLNVKEYLNVTINNNPINFEEEIEKAINNHGLYKEESMVTLILPNGSILPISLTFSLIYTDLQEIDGVSIMLVDLTQQTMEKNILHKKQLEAAELLIRERKLKNILDIGKDINQELIHPTPIQERLENILNTIVKFPTFQLAHLALHRDKTLYTAAMSRNGYLYLNYSEDIPNTNDCLNRLYKSFLEKKIFLCNKEVPTIYNQHARNLKLKMMLVLPLQNMQTGEPLGILSIACDSEDTFDIDVINYFEEFANDISLAITLQKHQDQLASLKEEKEKNYEQTILSFVQMIEERDIYTKGHSVRVATYAKMLGEDMGLSQKECEDLYKAGILHDIGKIQTPDKILLKPARLDCEELALVKEHVSAGVRMLKHIDIYKDLVQIINEHHERQDGKGYPHGLKGEEISLQGKIMALADAFDAMTTNRVYHQSLTVQEALQELRRCAGTQFDSNVIKSAEKLFSKLKLDKVDQLVESHILYERMAYFFRDPLTDMFNEEYFRHYVALPENIQNKYTCVYRISGLDKYNEKKSWCAGNEIIKKTAQLLKTEFASIANNFFRLHGNKFLIMLNEEIDTDKHMQAFTKFYEGLELKAKIECYDEKIFQENSKEEYAKLIHTLIC